MADEENVICQKTFQYCYIRWDVRNFSLLSCPNEYEIFGPEFSINYPAVTKWKLGLRSTCTGELGNLSIFLERLGTTHFGPEIVLVNWKAVILDRQNVEQFSNEYKGKCQKNKQIELDLLGYPEIKNILVDYLPDTLEICCYLIVNHDASSEKQYDPNLDNGLQSLSDDLKRLYYRGTFYDIVLKFCDVTFRAHRAILSARNLVIHNAIQAAPSRSEVEFWKGYADDGGEAIDRVLRYLYTGDVHYIVKKPTISLVSFTGYLAMEEIEPFFRQHSFNMMSKVINEEFEYCWTIEHFLANDRDYLRSQTFTSESEDFGEWKLHLYTRGVDRDGEHMDIFVEYVRGSNPLDVAVLYTVLDMYDGPYQESRAYGRVQVTGSISIFKFFPRDRLDEVLKGDELRVICTIQVSKKEVVSTILSEKEEPNPAPTALSLFYSGLAFNVKKLFLRNIFPDVVLTTPDKTVSAHKSILAARSKTLATILRRTNKNVINLDTRGTILVALLRYMYSGELECPVLVVLKRLYESAVVFGVPALKELCSIYLTSLFSVETIGDILEFAENNQDEELKSAAVSFICESQNEDDQG